ncbi:MAG: hypothetical protein ABIQ39_15140, partial [Ilumatobacteraceae bacterium]
GAWDTQMTDQPVKADRPINLNEPVDEECDMGARGIFAGQARGFFDPSFLKSLPSTAVTFAKAAGQFGGEKIAWLGRTDGKERTRLAGTTAVAAGGVGWIVRRARGQR